MQCKAVTLIGEQCKRQAICNGLCCWHIPGKFKHYERNYPVEWGSSPHYKYKKENEGE